MILLKGGGEYNFRCTVTGHEDHKCDSQIRSTRGLKHALRKVKETWHGQVRWPILRICALHLTHPKCTHTAVNTHTANTDPEQWAAICAAVSEEQLGVLLKDTSVVVLKLEESAGHSLPHLQFLPDLRLELATLGLRVRLSNIRPRLRSRTCPSRNWLE